MRATADVLRPESTAVLGRPAFTGRTLNPPQVTKIDLQLSRCRVRIFRQCWELDPDTGQWQWLKPSLKSRHAVVITELPPGGRSDRFANPGRPAIECLADLVPELNRTFLLRVPDRQITWFYHRAAVVTPARPRRHDEVYRLSALGPIAGCHVPLLIEASRDELDCEAGGMVEL